MFFLEQQPAITELLDAVSSHNIMDMEPDLDSEFYGIGDPDEVLYLTPKEDAKEGKVDEHKKTDKEEEEDASSSSKSDKKEKCAKSKETKKNTLKADDGKASKKDDNESDDSSECMEGENQQNTKITVDTTKKLTEDDLVVEPLDEEENWEEAFNFENV